MRGENGTRVLRARAPGKVNLCLYLGPIRDDGRHELLTVFESLSLADALTARVGPDVASDVVRCPGVDGENLAVVALRGLRAAGWAGPPVEVTIDKRVPVAAGMGGGSGDAAAVLRLAAALSEVSSEVLRQVAVDLGADVPSQLQPGVWLGTGAGEVLRPGPSVPPHAVVVVPLPFALATPAVYAEADRLGLPRTAGALEELHHTLVIAPGRLVNDLAPAAVSLRAEVDEVLSAVRAAGAEDALVCGSGPTVAGVFWGPDGPARAQVAAVSLREARPRVIVCAPAAPADWVVREDPRPAPGHRPPGGAEWR